MKYGYSVIKDGVFYSAGQDVPEKVSVEKPKPLIEETKDEKPKARNAKR